MLPTGTEDYALGLCLELLQFVLVLKASFVNCCGCDFYRQTSFLPANKQKTLADGNVADWRQLPPCYHDGSGKVLVEYCAMPSGFNGTFLLCL